MLALLLAFAQAVGPAKGGGVFVATGQLVRPAGEIVSFPGRPVACALSPDGKWLYAKDNRGLVVLDAADWKLKQELPFPRGKGGGSMHGLAVSRDGSRIYATSSGNALCEARSEAGKVSWLRSIDIPGPGGKGASYPTGIALAPDGKRAWVCLSRNNSLAVVDLDKGAKIAEIPAAWPRSTWPCRRTRRAPTSPTGADAARRPASGPPTRPALPFWSMSEASHPAAAWPALISWRDG